MNQTLALAEARPPHGVRLVQGSHIVVPRLFDHDSAYIFQNGDGRIVFAIPYQGEFTLIGTTDKELSEPPSKAEATPEEIDYLCTAVSEYFKAQVSPDQVVWSYAGVRALADEGKSSAQAATRDYVLTLEAGQDRAPLLSVYGGKITTFRRLAEAALDKLKPHMTAARKPVWTGSGFLPGGDLGPSGGEGLMARLQVGYPFLAPEHVRRLALSYGSRAKALFGDAASSDDLGRSVRRRPDRARGRLSDGGGMGADGGGCAVAADQAWPPRLFGSGRAPRYLYGRRPQRRPLPQGASRRGGVINRYRASRTGLQTAGG